MPTARAKPNVRRTNTIAVTNVTGETCTILPALVLVCHTGFLLFPMSYLSRKTRCPASSAPSLALQGNDGYSYVFFAPHPRGRTVATVAELQRGLEAATKLHSHGRACRILLRRNSVSMIIVLGGDRSKPGEAFRVWSFSFSRIRTLPLQVKRSGGELADLPTRM